MKKFLCYLQLFVFLFCVNTPMLANAEFSPSRVGTVKKSSLIAYINNYPISSYVMNGYTFIQVEDLSSFGFDIKWNEYSKSLCIIRNGNNAINMRAVFTPLSSELGKKDFDMYTTEVKTYIGNYGYEIECYAGKPGCTYINIDNLSVFGQVQWVPELNQMKVWIKDGLNCADIPFPVRKDIRFLPSYHHSYMPGNSVSNYYHFSHLRFPDRISFWFGEFSEKNNEIASYTYCTFSKLYIDIYDNDGNKVYTSSKLYHNTNDMTYIPYLLDFSDAPLTYELEVPIAALSIGKDYMAKVTHWCSYCDTGETEDIYFSL